MAATGAGVPSGQARQFESEGQRSSPSLVGPGFQTTKHGRVLVLRQTSISRPSSVGSTSATSDSNASSLGGGGRCPRRNRDICVGEELRIAVDRVLDRFRRTEDYEEVEFPSSLSNVERAYVHRLASTLGLKSKSHGQGAARFLSVTKKSSNASACSAASLKLRRESVHWISSLLQKYPLTSKERQDLLSRTSKSTEVDGLKDLFKNVTGRLNNGLPQVPPQKSDSPFSSVRQSLPISQYQSEILNIVQSHQVTLIVGETGSGKTTQVPQMILEDCHERKCPCRIICTQPRRIAALSIAERVAAERGEKVGQTVGYQIRLESRVSPRTLLTFCTNGVLLRTLMGSPDSLEGVTHVIVDEVHERDKYSDFLLICMQLALSRFRHLKLINMSASLNVDLFVKYFEGCSLVKIPGRLFEVKQWFLEDVLKLTGYSNSKMQKFKAVIQSEAQQHSLKDWCQKMVSSPNSEKRGGGAPTPLQEDLADIDDFVEKDEPEKDELEPEIAAEMDALLSELWMTGNEDIFSKIFHLLGAENVTVDYQHSQTCVTPLMAAAARGMVGPAEQLINLGANLYLKTVNGLTALDIAKQFEHGEVVALLQMSADQIEEDVNDIKEDDMVSSEEDRRLLNAYHHSVDEDKVDVDLILSLLHLIHGRHSGGAVLVFLPGYDEIMAVKDAITEKSGIFDPQRYSLFILHSAVQSADQKKVFKKTSPAVQKIILSTNIAESSVTIDDVVYVIDSGKVKEKSYDALSSATVLKSNWISKANAIQRCGRAGRCQPGECFHLFSRVRFSCMPEYQVPEILRSPLQELCLHAKLLAPTDGSIADFLSRAPEPPSPLILRNAVRMLQAMEALDMFEDLTELGHHLVDLPVEPRLGKMILCSVVLKCLDPILTIACTLAYKDPFLMPSVPSQKRAATAIRRKFAADTYSDHMSYLRVFHAWQKARADGWERSFCEKNFVSSSTMEMILGMRTQVLGQLRASGFVRPRGNSDIRDLNTNSENWAVVKAAICSGLYPHVVRVDKDSGCLVSPQGGRVRVHQSSVLSPPVMGKFARGRGHSAAAVVNELPTDWLVYEEMSQAQYAASVRCVTAVSSITTALFCGPARLSQEAAAAAELAACHVTGSQEGGHVLPTSSDSEGGSGGSVGAYGRDGGSARRKTQWALDELLVFSADPHITSAVFQLRQKWNSLFLRRLRAPSKPCSPMDELIVKAVAALLSLEEQAAGLQQPIGVGQRPRMMTSPGFGTPGASHEPFSEPSMPGTMPSTGSGELPADMGRPKTSPRGSRVVAPSRGEPGEAAAASTYASAARSLASAKDGRLCSNGSRSARHNSPGADRSPDNSSAGASHCQTPGSAEERACRSQLLSKSAVAAACESEASFSSSGCCYFVMKCSNHKCLDISMTKQVWATTPSNERKLSKAHQEGKNVYLIFSVQGSGHFQGFAKMSGTALKERCLLFGVPGLGGAIPISWMKRSNLPFRLTHHLLNLWNENKKVQVSRDGQEIEPGTGEALVRLWDQLPHYPVKQTSGKPRHREGRGGAGRDAGGRPSGSAAQPAASAMPSSPTVVADALPAGCTDPAAAAATVSAAPCLVQAARGESRDRPASAASASASSPVVILQRSTSLSSSGP